MPIQFLIALFALFAAARAGQAYRAGTIDRRKLIVWWAFWVVVVAAIFSPGSTVAIANLLGVGRGVDLVLYLSVVVLFYGLFQQSRKVDRLERHLTDLVRQLALRDDDNDGHQQSS